jgi:hypothetical protein
MFRRLCAQCTAVLLLQFGLAPSLMGQRAVPPENTPAVLAPPTLPGSSPVQTLESESHSGAAERRLDSTLSTESEAAAPSGRDFAYQVLLIVVSAVVTALVWKAIN